MIKTYKASIIGLAKSNHPDYKTNEKIEFSDVYTIDTDYFYDNDSILSYIKNDMLLVIGGGYDKDTVKNVKFEVC